MKMKVDMKDILTLVVCIVIFTWSWYNKYMYENPPLPECVDVYNISERCDR